MGEQSDTIPESEFERWLTPPDALEALKGMGGSRSHALIERLAAGLATAAAETYRWKRSRNEDVSRPHWIIPQSVWEDHPPAHGYGDFWETGQFKFSVHEFQRSDSVHSYFGVRFDPKGVEDLRRAAGLTPRTVAPALSETPTPTPAAKERSQLSKSEAERFCRAVLEGWGDDLTQDWAYEKVVLFFPDKKVPRDWFRSILRSIRGSIKPGKKAKISD